MCDHDQRVQEILGAGGVNQQFPEHGSWDQIEVGSSTSPRILWKIWHDHGGILELKKAALIMFVSFPETCVLIHVQCALFLCLHFLISKLLPLSPTWSLRTRFIGGTTIGARLAAMCGLFQWERIGETSQCYGSLPRNTAAHEHYSFLVKNFILVVAVSDPQELGFFFSFGPFGLGLFYWLPKFATLFQQCCSIEET